MNSPDTVPGAVPVTPAVPDPASGRACDPPVPFPFSGCLLWLVNCRN